MEKWIALLLLLAGLGVMSKYADRSLDALPQAILGLVMAIVGAVWLLVLGFELL